MKKIGIIYMCTGNYKIFWKKFYESSEKYLLSNTEKYYFVFTDGEKIEYEDENGRIHKKYLEHQKWPYITLLRYDVMVKNKELFSNMDYLFFFNANIEFIKKVSEEELLPGGDELVVVKAKTAEADNLDDYYEKNIKSTAYVSDGDGLYYVYGGLNGGSKESYLRMAHVCNTNIQNDLERGVIAAWHDQAHMNRYIIDNPKIRVLDPTIYLAYPNAVQENTKIMVLDKNNGFRYGQAYLRSGKSFAQGSKYRENLIVYGTGKVAEEWYQKFKDKVTIKCFVCSNPTIDYFHGIEVKKADKELLKQGFVILALVKGFSSVYALMRECGLEEYKDYLKAGEYIL